MSSTIFGLRFCRQVRSLAIVLALWAYVPRASAADLFYSLSGGTLTGTLNGVNFTNASYTISATGNPANVQIGSINGIETHYLALTTTLAIEGFAPVTFSNPNFGIFSIMGDGGANGSSGFAAYPDPTGFRILGLDAYVSLLVPDSVTGALRRYEEKPFPTSGGDLIIGPDGYGNVDPTFAITPVPEPHAMVQGAIGGLTVGLLGMVRVRSSKK